MESFKMKITEIKLRMPVHNEPYLIAWVSCVIDEKLFINNIAVRKKIDGNLYLNFPRYKAGSGNEYPYFKPITQEAYQTILKAILEAISFDGDYRQGVN